MWKYREIYRSIYIYTYIHTYIHACIHTYIHMCIDNSRSQYPTTPTPKLGNGSVGVFWCLHLSALKPRAPLLELPPFLVDFTLPATGETSRGEV